MNAQFYSKYILLFESCHLTKGVTRTLLVDHQRGQIEFLDNKLYNILIVQNRKKSIGEILERYNSEEKKILSEYFEYLLEKEYAFTCNFDEISLFPKISQKWEDPSYISNAIIDINSASFVPNHYAKFVSDLSDLGCENIQIRDFNGVTLDYIKSVLDLFEGSGVFRLELLLKHQNEIQSYIKLLHEYPRINELVLHSFEDKIKSQNIQLNTDQRFLLTEKKITDHSFCGIVSRNMFNLDLRHYLESLDFNTCLNKKIAVDVNGAIKNCPSMKKEYGHIKNNSIKDVVKRADFQSLWSYSKSKISVCRDCEFRDLCTDCRAFLDHDLSKEKPSKCNYDPYTNEWGVPINA